MPNKHIALLPGDGIGSEVLDSAPPILALPDLGLTFEQYPCGAGEYLRSGNPLPQRTMEACCTADAGLSFNPRRRLLASVRDFARVAWFWLQRGRWKDEQLLKAEFFRKYQKPDVPFSLPHTQEAGNDDYLGIGTFGGGSDHFTKFGPGVYGFNWWFNRTSRPHPDRTAWPDAPANAILSIGAGGNCSAIFPSSGVVLASARGKSGQLSGGAAQSPMNRRLKLLTEAVGNRN